LILNSYKLPDNALSIYNKEQLGYQREIMRVMKLEKEKIEILENSQKRMKKSVSVAKLNRSGFSKRIGEEVQKKQRQAIKYE